MREERVHELLYSCDSRTELCERIVALEDLVRDLRDHIESGDGFGVDTGWMLDRIRKLGVEGEP